MRILAGLVAKGNGSAWRAAAALVDATDGATLAAVATDGAKSREAALLDAFAKLPPVARGVADALLVDTEDASLAERVGRAVHHRSAAVARAPPLDGLAPGEAEPLTKEGVLLGHTWRPRESFEPLLVLPGHKLDASEALAAARAATTGAEPAPLAAARKALR